MPETITAPAPAAIATKPVAPSPAPKPEPKPAAESPSGLETDSDFEKLDARILKNRTPLEKKEDKPADKPGDKPEEKAKETADKPEEKKVDPAPDKSKENRTLEPKALRAEYEKTKSELKAEREAKATLEKRIAEAESKGKDTTTLAKQLAEKDTEAENLRAELRAARREVSPEFKEKFDQPFENAAKKGEKLINQMSILDADGVEVRKASWEKDFAPIYSLEWYEAKKRAKELFGDDASIIMEQYNRLHGLDDDRKEALVKERENWSKLEEKEKADNVRQQEAVAAMWVKYNEDVSAKRPELFKELPGDDEDNKLWKEGLALVDAQPATLQERVMLDAQKRLRAAAVPRLLHRNAKLTERVAELEEKLKAASASDPGDTQRKGAQENKPEKGWREDMRESVS